MALNNERSKVAFSPEKLQGKLHNDAKLKDFENQNSSARWGLNHIGEIPVDLLKSRIFSLSGGLETVLVYGMMNLNREVMTKK